MRYVIGMGRVSGIVLLLARRLWLHGSGQLSRTGGFVGGTFDEMRWKSPVRIIMVGLYNRTGL